MNQSSPFRMDSILLNKWCPHRPFFLFLEKQVSRLQATLKEFFEKERQLEDAGRQEFVAAIDYAVIACFDLIESNFMDICENHETSTGDSDLDQKLRQFWTDLDSLGEFSSDQIIGAKIDCEPRVCMAEANKKSKILLENLKSSAEALTYRLETV